MKVLFVAFEFAPLGAGGVQRSMKFAKYLPANGITPIVITTDIHSYQKNFDHAIDLSLLDELPQDLLVERISCPATYKEKRAGIFTPWRRSFFYVLERYMKDWKFQTKRCLPQLLDRHKPEAIYVSMPPFGAGVMWCEFARKYKLPIVLDFRDAWSQWNIYPYRSWAHYYLTLRYERRCLNIADQIICSSEQIRKDLLTLHRNLPEDKIVTITNGYDAEIEDWEISPIKDLEHGEFVIGYVGSFYYAPANREAMMMPWRMKRFDRKFDYVPRKEDWLYRSPHFFFKAINALLETKPLLRKKLKIKFAGHKPTWIDKQVDAFDLKDVVEFTGYLEHQEAVKFMAECDCLLITSSKVLGGLDYSIAGKTFEYFSSRKPILGFVADGAQKEILLKSGMAIICDPDNTEEAVNKITNLIEGKLRFKANTSFLKSLHRKELSKSLAYLIHKLKKTTRRFDEVDGLFN